MATVGTEAPALCESRRQQLLPPPTAGRASPRLYGLRDPEPLDELPYDEDPRAVQQWSAAVLLDGHARVLENRP